MRKCGLFFMGVFLITSFMHSLCVERNLEGIRNCEVIRNCSEYPLNRFSKYPSHVVAWEIKNKLNNIKNQTKLASLTKPVNQDCVTPKLQSPTELINQDCVTPKLQSPTKNVEEDCETPNLTSPNQRKRKYFTDSYAMGCGVEIDQSPRSPGFFNSGMVVIDEDYSDFNFPFVNLPKCPTDHVLQSYDVDQPRAPFGRCLTDTKLTDSEWKGDSTDTKPSLRRCPTSDLHK